MGAERDEVASELWSYLISLGLDDPWSDTRKTSSRWRHTDDGELYSAERLELHARLIRDELATQPKVSRRGTLGVVVTAGPPGAGKSTALAADAGLTAFRNVDADRFKDPLLIAERASGALTDLLAETLPDGRPVSLRELSGFVHAESTSVATTLRDRCLAEGENVIVHGTLSSAEYSEELLGDLDHYGYQKLVIVDVEVPVERAVDQALARWWADRTSDPDGLGGRFVAPETVRRHYDDDATALSRCGENAQQLHDRARELGWAVELRRLAPTT